MLTSRKVALLGGRRGTPAWVLRSGGTAATLDIDFVNGNAWNGGPGSASITALLACTRATPAAAYYTNANGTLVTFAANTLRYGTNGLLVEEARTNLCLRSQEFDNATWELGNNTVTANQDTAPDGTVTADLVTLTDISHNPHQQITVSASTDYTFSFYAKRTAADLKYSVYDISNGADIVASTSYFSSTNSSTYSRISVSFTTPVGCTVIWVFAVRDSGVTGTFYLWGAQLEAKRD
jgi:hypothetical protein